jgi:Arc/MetJ family transcription regulator
LSKTGDRHAVADVDRELAFGRRVDAVGSGMQHLVGERIARRQSRRENQRRNIIGARISDRGARQR